MSSPECDHHTTMPTVNNTVMLDTAATTTTTASPVPSVMSDTEVSPPSTPTLLCNGCNGQHHSPTSITMTTIRQAVSHLTRLDDFNAIKLSQGFFSQVFKVTHRTTRKVMVLKMNKQAANRGNALKEIELLNKLNHENIVQFMGTVVHEGGLHPLLEYINGGTLEKLIRQYYKIDTYFDENKKLITRTPQTNGTTIDNNINNTINYYNNNNNNNHNNNYTYCPQLYRLNDVDQTFVRIAEDVARGMDYLHSLHYLHRDLTSKNVFIRVSPPITDDTDEYDAEPYLQAVIGDFGFATVDPHKDQKLPTVGSPYWLAPECIKGQWYNHKCDIFSYGVICCELNWRIPSDPDYLCRDDSFLINFDKLPDGSKETLLARLARLTTQKNPSIRPEFSEVLEFFETELMSDKSPLNNANRMRYILKREMSLPSSDSSLESVTLNGAGDIFDQHLIRRRNSQIERKYFNTNGWHR
ncbi:dual specificity testis-specific protein kinase 2-like [Oppia nitens]|uniref:dual specificity testis-specific protein kinase 2-like n=1 Tax=Oppia nitens TaxID=1686743 RepID=UPI0023DBCD27|nr:dual specificity testis-specific protein kinase 2-like [Oppia nitens]